MADKTFRWFAGVDWGSAKHQACLLDEAGTVVGERAFAHGGAGLAALCDWLVRGSSSASSMDPPPKQPSATETSFSGRSRSARTITTVLPRIAPSRLAGRGPGGPHRAGPGDHGPDQPRGSVCRHEPYPRAGRPGGAAVTVRGDLLEPNPWLCRERAPEHGDGPVPAHHRG